MKKVLFLILFSMSFQSFAGWEVLSKEDKFTGKITKYGLYVKDQERKVILLCGTQKTSLSVLFRTDIDLGDNEKNAMDYNFKTNEGGVVEYNVDGNFGKIAILAKNETAAYDLSIAQSSYEFRKSISKIFSTNDSIEDQPVDIIDLMKKGNVLRVKFHGINGDESTEIIDLKGFTNISNKIKKYCISNN